MPAVIETERLQLHALAADSDSDVAFMHRLLNEPSFLHNIGDRGVRSFEDARAYLLKGPVASYAANGFGLYRMQLKASGETVGTCGLVKRATLEDADLGYALLPEFCGMGYAVEAATGVLAHGHGALGLPRILAITNPDNTASIRVLEKLDFRFENMVQWPPDNIALKLFAHETPR
jgi:ribosomal-protein-alanine N-acetyltransferase